MSIRITCPGCHTRFNVSEKFAGREGPCPKCKNMIKIPSLSEEVKIHAPDVGPKDTQGRPILKPIGRTETELSPVLLTIILGSIGFFLLSALLIRWLAPGVAADSSQRELVGWGSALLLAFPCVFAAYSFLRDSEKGSFIGRELYARIGIAAAVYVGTWGFMYLSWFAFASEWNQMTWLVGVGLMLAAGGAVGMLSFDFDYLTGLLHYGLYFAACFASRGLSGIGWFPGWLDQGTEPVRKALKGSSGGIEFDELGQSLIASAGDLFLSAWSFGTGWGGL